MTSNSLSLRLPSADLERLHFLSKVTNRPKSFYVKEAIHHHLAVLEATYLSSENPINNDWDILHTDDLESGYQAMAADSAREIEAREWCNGLAVDMANETSINQQHGACVPW